MVQPAKILGNSESGRIFAFFFLPLRNHKLVVGTANDFSYWRVLGREHLRVDVNKIVCFYDRAFSEAWPLRETNQKNLQHTRVTGQLHTPLGKAIGEDVGSSGTPALNLT